MQFFDADHDGDLDLFLANDGPNELLNNNLDGTFRPLAVERGLTGSGQRSLLSVVADLDRDRDLDIVVVNEQPPHDVYLNDRLWAYRTTADLTDFQQHPLLTLLAADRDVDGRPELIGMDGEGVILWQVDAEGRWRRQRLPMAFTENFAPQPPLALADVDGDGGPDLLAASRSECVVVDAISGKTKQRMSLTGPWKLANLSPDRGPSLVCLTGPTPQILPPGPGRFDYLRVRFTGKDERAEQMRSNRSGLGVDAAARLGSQWVSLRTLRSDSGPGQDLQPVAVGLHGRSALDFVRLTWPDGVFQTEFGLDRGRLHQIAETQRQVASCPIVFAWDGTAYSFVTDVLGGAGLGFNLGFGQYTEPRPWEHLLLTSASLQPRAGRYEIKLGEPMEEACYVDAVRLVAYDLDAGWNMTVDERFAVEGPIPTGRPLFYRHQQRPIAATNDRGESVLEAIDRADLCAADPGQRDRRFIGRTEPHWIELTFAEPIDHTQPCLLFDGWIEYPYSQTMFAAWQADAAFDAPTIEAASDTGPWQTVAARFGYMAGMPRQAVVPLDLRALPAGTRRLRVSCNLEIYWDRLAVIHVEPPPAPQRHDLRLREALVAEVGFARRTTHDQRRPDYDYSRRSPVWDTRHLKGYYSQWGTALDLVDDIDDAVAIIGPGEELHLEFDAAPSPVTVGQRRWFVLELNGWCKDMDLYTRDGETVGPLPERDPRPDESRRVHRDFLHQLNHRRYRSGH